MFCPGHEEDLEFILAPIIHIIAQTNTNGADISIGNTLKIANAAQSTAVAIKPFTAMSWVLFFIKRKGIGWCNRAQR